MKGKAIRKDFSFKSFRSSIVFVNRIATLADEARSSVVQSSAQGFGKRFHDSEYSPRSGSSAVLTTVVGQVYTSPARDVEGAA